MSSVFERFVKSTPIRGKDVFIAKGAIVYGAVTLMDHSSIWFNAVLRADINQIIIGKYSNVQDNATFHTGASNSSILGDYVTVCLMMLLFQKAAWLVLVHWLPLN